MFQETPVATKCTPYTEYRSYRGYNIRYIRRTMLHSVQHMEALKSQARLKFSKTKHMKPPHEHPAPVCRISRPGFSGCQFRRAIVWRQPGRRLVMWVENGLDATSKYNKMGVPYRKKISRIHRLRRGGLAADQRQRFAFLCAHPWIQLIR